MLLNEILCEQDYMDAFERILKLNMKGHQDREVPRVIMHCCAQEKAYNPYYALLAEKFCTFDRKFKFTFQLAFWDEFKKLHDTNIAPRRLANLAQFLAHLCNSFALSLSLLKVRGTITGGCAYV